MGAGTGQDYYIVSADGILCCTKRLTGLALDSIAVNSATDMLASDCKPESRMPEIVCTYQYGKMAVAEPAGIFKYAFVIGRLEQAQAAREPLPGRA